MLRFALLLLVPLAFAACATTEKVKSTDIVTTIPWDVPETATYRLTDNDNDGKEVGTMVLSIEAAGAGKLKFTQSYDFPENGFTNEAVVIAGDTELQPESASFEVSGPDGNLTCDATYEAGEVKAHRVGEDGERDDSEDVPVFTYDSWSDLIVWRTIAFAEGYDEKYADTLSCTLDRTQVLSVELKVKEQESVEVPAGTFDAWHLEIKSGGRTQDAWYSTDDAHTLIKYDNDELTFELTELG